jgi:leucine dehydrogenase
LKQAEKIYDVIGKILEISSKEKIPSYEASNKMAEERIKSIGKISKMYTGKSSFSGRLGEMFVK